ncbi:glyoxylase I 4-like [Salvia hispanica]|uniref:glyoxylase I 4-like n=1 Tax=Salvia hispanica TaxID=49212 RepID=UPI0020099546|nr:glyoxylase I 4-like [Salvia hispanica]
MQLDSKRNVLQLSSLNHISLVCKSVDQTNEFYINVLGFVPVKRPAALQFPGAWLVGHGIGIHLLQTENPENLPNKTVINTKDNHISFQCENMGMVEKKLGEMGIDWVRQRVEEGGIDMDQVFFHDPDGFMIEICNCESIPIIPLDGKMHKPCALNKTRVQHQQIRALAPRPRVGAKILSEGGDIIITNN